MWLHDLFGGLERVHQLKNFNPLPLQLIQDGLCGLAMVITRCNIPKRVRWVFQDVSA